MKPSLRLALLWISLALAPSALLHAQDPEQPKAEDADASSTVFARQGDAVLTAAEVDAAIDRIPPNIRLPYIRNGERMNQLVASLLRAKLIVADAEEAGYDQQEVIQTRMQLAAEGELAEAWIEHVVETAPAADYDQLAQEYYLANPDKFQTEEMVDVSQILIGNEQRSDAEALELANRLVAELRENPSRFGEMVEEYSDDPSKKVNNGRFPGTKRGEMVKPFEDQAFSMEEVGEISDPVKTNYGYHIIRLNAKYPPKLQPFDAVKQETEEMARKKYLADYRSLYIKKLIAEPISVSEDAVEAMAKRYFGENLELAAEYKD